MTNFDNKGPVQNQVGRDQYINYHGHNPDSLRGLAATSQAIFNALGKGLRSLVLTIIGLLIMLNLFQTWQFLHGIIHESRMTKAAYFAAFGKTKIPKLESKNSNSPVQGIFRRPMRCEESCFIVEIP